MITTRQRFTTPPPRNALLPIGVALVLMSLLAFARTVSAEGPELDGPEARFQAAKAAYDAGRFSESSDLYESMLADGWYSPELFFNAGNAFFRQGRMGKAILNYRRALHLRPGDGDATANLSYALETAGITAPPETAADRMFGWMSSSHWRRTVLLSYWLLAAALLLTFLDRVRAGAWRRCAALFALVLAASLAGSAHWRMRLVRPEVVVVAPGQDVRYAPLESATVFFPAPEGTLLREVDKAEGWIKVTAGGRTGWLPRRGSERVYPWF